MTRVYKFTLKIEDEQKIPLHDGAKILSIQKQGEQICLWAEVDPEKNAPLGRIICVHGTGHELRETPGKLRFIGTVQDGPLVWHFHERVSAYED